MADTFEEKLAELVRNYDHIYDVSLPLHSDKHACQNTWREIGAVLGVDMKICRSKWKLLRDRYVRARRKMQEKRSGDGAEGSICPPIIRRLSWLQKFVNHRATDTNFCPDKILAEDDDVSTPGLISAGEAAASPAPLHCLSTDEPLPSAPSPSSASTSASCTPATPLGPRRKRKRGQDQDNLDAALLHHLQGYRQEKEKRPERRPVGRRLVSPATCSLHSPWPFVESTKVLGMYLACSDRSRPQR
ncbi:uncharacterized protein LOC133421580 [Cololabis saira]|uniref:uncharacterized protein LOC133421580 n=1 Tax=Cololabis saira TaxID=129043 RepID=UPI002AD44759|nr:uncharacterized protein LOC133421580 [Cololabis saira]